MSNEKIVVVLLLITIILSVTSVIMTLSANAGDSSASETMNLEKDDGSVNIQVKVLENPNTSGGTG